MILDLPRLELLEEHDNDWAVYVDHIYELFKTDFILHTPSCSHDGLKVVINWNPMNQGKEFTFWHITSTGTKEDERIPDLRRCEHIRYPRFLIENFRNGPVKVWEKEVQAARGGREKRIHMTPYVVPTFGTVTCARA